MSTTNFCLRSFRLRFVQVADESLRPKQNVMEEHDIDTDVSIEI